MGDKAKYIMVGGFLGAGKTTAVTRLAQHLRDAGLRVGLITNDQGSELVDTSMLKARGFATEEISGGCFCCRFSSLVEAAQKLTAEARPDAFIAEPVGSCTDLMATVSYPLRRIYGDRFAIAPVSVLVDPVRAEQVFGLRSGRTFSSKVLYIWRKQVEEADALVINKRDLLSKDAVDRLCERFAAEFPGKKILTMAARTGEGTDAWIDYLLHGPARNDPAMRIDYDTYADGEALLGWMNATVRLDGSAEFDSTRLLEILAGEMQRNIDGEIAHLKMTFSPDDSLAGEIAALSLVRSDFVPELTMRLEEKSVRGELIVNCRAEAAPDQLRAALDTALALLRVQSAGTSFTLEHAEQFRPGRPNPTHRMAAA